MPIEKISVDSRRCLSARCISLLSPLSIFSINRRIYFCLHYSSSFTIYSFFSFFNSRRLSHQNWFIIYSFIQLITIISFSCSHSPSGDNFDHAVTLVSSLVLVSSPIGCRRNVVKMNRSLPRREILSSARSYKCAPSEKFNVAIFSRPSSLISRRFDTELLDNDEDDNSNGTIFVVEFICSYCAPSLVQRDENSSWIKIFVTSILYEHCRELNVYRFYVFFTFGHSDVGNYAVLFDLYCYSTLILHKCVYSELAYQLWI